MRKDSYKNASYDNAKPSWHKHRKKDESINLPNVWATLDWDKLATIGKDLQ